MQWLWREDDQPGDPWTNMAVDQALFEGMIRGEIKYPIVRVYRWDRPCISIGRLQNEQEVRREYANMPLVRRPTGGQAVLHQDDLTFAVIARADWLPALDKGILSSYRLIMEGFLLALQRIGIAGRMGHDEQKKRSVLCFDRVARCDVAEIGTGRKLVGSAQRREQGCLLQQITFPVTFPFDEKVFLSHLRSCLTKTLDVMAWLTVDTPCTL